MWTETTDGRQFIEDVTKSIVAQVAPEELDMFDTLIQDYFENPTPPDPSVTDSDQALGFGLGEALAIATPAAAAAVSGVLTYILSEVLKTVQEESAAAITRRLKQLFKRDAEGRTETLSPDQLRQVQTIAIKQAEAFGMGPQDATKMATALVGALAVAA